MSVWCWVRSPLHSSRHISLLQHFGLDLRQLSPASKRPDACVLRSAVVLCGDTSVLMCSTFALVLAEKGGDRMRHYQLQGAWSAILRWLVLTVVILTLHLKLTNRTHFCGGWPKSQCPATCHQSAPCVMQCLWGCLVQQQHWAVRVSAWLTHSWSPPKQRFCGMNITGQICASQATDVPDAQGQSDAVTSCWDWIGTVKRVVCVGIWTETIKCVDACVEI